MAYFAYEYDCTNFASQIVHWAGMTPIRTQWQWNGTEQARRCWNVAHDFIEYWTLERGYNGGAYLTKADAKRHALPGDLIGYMDKKDYKIWHVTFAQSKSNGKIYVSQHTGDRHNEDWDGIDINNSTCIIVRF
ncbi:amidase domain-containing protein [Suipraeoptans intestinalis]|uniref:amidase domain-containing protein n=1 Tax=Suipraeoptans intestinalis TaxID=2606628 RepID=UPI003AB9B73D